MSSIFGGSTRSHHSSSHHHHHHKHSSSKTPSVSKVYIRPAASRSVPSLFGSTSKHHHRSPSPHHRSSSPAPSLFRSLFGVKHHSSSSSYRRRPRDGYVAYLLARLRRLVADLWRYARKHPLKAFLAVVVPLVSAGGAVGAVLRSLGVGGGILASFGVGGGGRRGGGGGGGGYYGSRGYGGDGSGDVMGTVGQVMKIAQAFV